MTGSKQARQVWNKQAMAIRAMHKQLLANGNPYPEDIWVEDATQGKERYSKEGSDVFDILIPGPEGMKMVQVKDNTMIHAIGEDSKLTWYIPEEHLGEHEDDAKRPILTNRQKFVAMMIVDEDGKEHQVNINTATGTFRPLSGKEFVGNDYHQSKYTLKARKVVHDDPRFRKYGLTFSIVGGDMSLLKAANPTSLEDEAPPDGTTLDESHWGDTDDGESEPPVPPASKPLGTGKDPIGLAKVASESRDKYSMFQDPDGSIFFMPTPEVVQELVRRSKSGSVAKPAAQYLPLKRIPNVFKALLAQRRTETEILDIWQDREMLMESNLPFLHPGHDRWLAARSRVRTFLAAWRDGKRALPEGKVLKQAKDESRITRYWLEDA